MLLISKEKAEYLNSKRPIIIRDMEMIPVKKKGLYLINIHIK